MKYLIETLQVIYIFYSKIEVDRVLTHPLHFSYILKENANTIENF